MSILSVVWLAIFLCSCGGRGGHTINPARQGMAGKSLDTIAARIEKNSLEDDRIGTGQDSRFCVYMMPLVDEDGRLSDEGLVMLKGASL